MIKNFEQLKEMLKAMPVKRKVAVVPAQDEHTLEAISHAYRDGMVEPVLIGAEPKIREILAQIGTDADKMTISMWKILRKPSRRLLIWQETVK